MPEWNGFEVDTEWSQGQAYAERLLARLSVPFVRYRFQLVNRDNTWSTVREGSIHTVNISTEGPTNAPITGQVRVLGFSPSTQDGQMEVIVEPYTP
jgi:hypothetical protein